MVTRLCTTLRAKHLICTLCLLPALLFSGQFTASVSHNPINLGESFTLSLTLKDATAKAAPSVDALKKSFSIASQQQLFNTVVMNGQATSSTTWKLSLVPLSEGSTLIPSIAIDTSEGVLSSDPIALQVVKAAPSTGADSSDKNDVLLSTDVSNAKPYKSQPFVYTVRIVSKRDLADLKLPNFNLEDAIIETHGEPKMYKQVVGGVNVSIIEVAYLITPLKGGSLKIPSIVIQGAIPVPRKNQSRSPFDDDFALSSLIHGFERLKTFALATEEAIIEVQPPIAGMNPWLPASALKIEETWNGASTLQVGEPFTRGFKIEAEGIASSQLPSLNHQLMSDAHFKIYADKPELSDEGKDGRIKSHRKEQYTLIPQQAGTLTLPELSLTWWDMAKNEKVITRIPAKTVHILSAPESTLKKMDPTAVETPAVRNLPAPAAQEHPILLYFLIGGLAILLLGVIFWAVILQKKIRQFAKVPAERKATADAASKERPTASPKREKLPDLNPT